MPSYISEFLLKNQFIQAILFIIFLFFLYYVKDILVVVFVAFIFMSAMTPFVEFLRKKRFPKALAVAIPYLLSVILLFAIVLSLVPFFISQVQNLIDKLPSYISQSFKLLRIKTDSIDIQSFLTSGIKTIGENVLVVSQRIFSSLFTFLTIMILTLYFLLDHGRIRKNFAHLFTYNLRKNVYETLYQVENKLGAWLRGQIALSFFIGILTWVLLTILRLDFALPLAVIAGIFEILPTIGPILSAVPAIIVALNISPTMAIIVIIAYIIIQVVESNIIVPLVMRHAVGFNPIIIILSIIIGGKLMGLEGALLSIPFVSAISILLKQTSIKAPQNK